MLLVGLKNCFLPLTATTTTTTTALHLNETANYSLSCFERLTNYQKYRIFVFCLNVVGCRVLTFDIETPKHLRDVMSLKD